MKIDPRKQALMDLASAVMKQAQKGDAILIGMDANAELESDRDFESFVHQCDLYDFFLSLPNSNKIPHTYKFSKRHLDYLLGCETVQAEIKVGA